MTEVKGAGRRIQLLDDLRKIRYWELKKDGENEKSWKKFFYEHKVEIQVLFHKSMDLLKSSIILNNKITSF